MQKKKWILGVDCGDVIFSSWGGVSIPGAFENLRVIVASKKFSEIHLVSKIDPVTEYAYRKWLEVNSFWAATDISAKNLHFCRRHEDKAPICAELGITHFVDDRLRVLRSLTTVPYRYALNPRPRDFERYADALPHITVVHSWDELRELLLSD
jgi:hypothetical protein